MFLEDIHVLLPVHPLEKVPEAASGARRTRADFEGALTLTDATGESEFVNLGEMLMLADRQPIALNQRLDTMNASVAGCQGASRNFQPTIWA